MIGRTLGHYRIESQLGAGGMGVVYRAYDTQLERSVAIKLVGERLLDEPSARDRLLREARTASSLNHPNICTIHEVGEAEGQVYIVMEYVEGRPLGQLLEQARPAEAVVRYGLQIADALAHAHQRGIVHRDLKTSNVVVSPEGRAKVLDFGLAKRLPTEGLEEQSTRTSDSLTEAGSVIGTLHYLAPELLRGQPADARSDIWALGVLLHELASGELPFQGRTRFEVTHAILGEAPRVLPAAVPAGLRAVIQRCLAKEPGERYQRAGEVRAALEAIQSGSIVLPVASRWRLPKWALGTAAGALALLLGAGGYRLFGGRTREIGSIAVLPFTNVGGNPENEYLSDGITEHVIGSLSQLPRLRVIAFGSVIRYKGNAPDLQAVARDLGVAATVIGRVTQRGQSLSISAELIDARDKSRLWGNQYEVKPADMLNAQDEISRQVSDRLRPGLTGDEQKRLTRRYTENTEAYQLYLKGNYYWYKFTPEAYEKSIDYYQQAIEKDPTYALAYAGLGNTYAAMTYEGLLPPGEGFHKAEAAVKKALEIDGSLAEAYGALGVVKGGQDWDWPGAEKAFQRALELDPSLVAARLFYAQHLRAVEHWDEAFKHMQKAQELDPLSVKTNEALGTLYFWAHRDDEAITQLRKTLELDPTAAEVHDLLVDVLARKGQYKEAIAEKQHVFRAGGDAETAEALGQDFQAHGYEAVMRQLYESFLESLKEGAKGGYVSPFRFALVYAKLGDRDQAFAWLERAMQERSPWLVWLKVDPELDTLHSDPRFAPMVKRIGYGG